MECPGGQSARRGRFCPEANDLSPLLSGANGGGFTANSSCSLNNENSDPLIPGMGHISV